MSGSYTQQFETTEGCDSIVTLMLTLADSNTNGIALPTQDGSPIKVYPNPTNGKLHFDKQVSEAVVYDASGRLIMKEHDAMGIDIERLANGVYVVRLVDNSEGTTTIVRVVKR